MNRRPLDRFDLVVMAVGWLLALAGVVALLGWRGALLYIGASMMSMPVASR